MDEKSISEHKAWVIDDSAHEGISIRTDGAGRYWISAWAENWDDIWSWEAEITREELQATIADPLKARDLLLMERRWRVVPPSSVRKDEYVKEGTLNYEDGFEDCGTGGKSS